MTDETRHGGRWVVVDRDLPVGTHYCPMLAIDISAFNDPRRGEDLQQFLRAAMYELLVGAFGRSHLPWPVCHHEDRGDGVLVIAPPGGPATALIDPLVDHLQVGLRRHNKRCSEFAVIRLRMSVHVGQVHFDKYGVYGYAVTHLFRLLEAAAFKRAFAASGADFALVASDALYQDVISQWPGLIDPGMYEPIKIWCKETRARAWLYLPPVRHPFLCAMSMSSQAREAVEANACHPTRPTVPAARDVIATALPHQPTTPRPRVAEPQDSPASERTSDRDRLVAVGLAMPSHEWLSGVPASSSWRPGFRERFDPGQRVQHDV